jgi:hypothetical protein
MRFRQRSNHKPSAHTIAQIQDSLDVIRSMKRNCTEAKKNIESVREAVEGMESQIREKITTLHIQLQIVK